MTPITNTDFIEGCDAVGSVLGINLNLPATLQIDDSIRAVRKINPQKCALHVDCDFGGLSTRDSLDLSDAVRELS